MFKYALKRVVRSYRLFVALTLGVLVATTFFASTNVAADILARDALDGSLEGVIYDFNVNSADSNWSEDTLDEIESELSQIPEITDYTRMTATGYTHNGTLNSQLLPAFQIFSIEWDSLYTEGLDIVAGGETLGPNETYVVSGSVNETLFSVGDIVTVPIGIELSVPPYATTIEWNYTVAGIVDLPEAAREGLQQNQFAGILRGAFGFSFEFPYNVMISDYDLSGLPLLNAVAGIENKTSTSLFNSYHIEIDRTGLIDPYDIEASSQSITAIQNRIASRLERFDVEVSSNLMLPLLTYMIISIMMNFTFFTLSLPIFFMAYFTGTMVSDVGYNLRRREIGLLLTKGYKRGTIRNMLLIEGVIVGAIAGGASVFLGSYISWMVLQIAGLDFVTVLANNISAITLSIILGMILALVSVWRPANRASKLEILDALKQYVYIEETSEYKRLLPTLAFILGSFKLILWILGISADQMFSLLNIGGNITLAIIVLAVVALDQLLNFIGPLLFLYGTTKLFLRGSQRFQEIIVNAGQRFFGAFGKLATRNIKRNPARNAAMVFLISLIVSYGVFAVGSLYSENDLVERNALFEVGADVRLEFANGANLTSALETIEAHEDVDSATIEYRLNLLTGSTIIETRSIDPDLWLDTAFWENYWFLGDVNVMMDGLDDGGIILSLTTANDLGVGVGDSLYVRTPLISEPIELEIVGLIGYQSALEGLIVGIGGPGGDTGSLQLSVGDYPSFVSSDYLNDSNFLIGSEKNILIDTVAGVNGTTFQEEMIEEFSLLDRSYSFTSEMVNYWARPIESGITKIRWVAISFSVILALVGTALVIILSLREKESEIALITVRGFSKWQLFKTLIAEMMIMVIFSILLGSFVGLVQIFGNVSQLNENVSGLIRYGIVIGGASGLTMLAIMGVVILAAALPVWWASRRPEAKVDVLRA
ncbi:MAG: FtsX-like permease family protein [Candidatus Thorarchaeota archaeon]|jgi:ABC-type antimicrobial peptide transport system permease subunit